MRAGVALVLVATAAGLAVALAVTLFQPSTYRAEGTIVLTREGRAPGDDPTLGPAAAAAVELLESRTVAESAAANLRLEGSAQDLLDRTGADVSADSSLLRLSVEAGEPEEARRTAQELAEVFTVLYNTRFGPETTAVLWEAPRAAEGRVSPDPVRNLLLGGAGGTLAGLALLALRRRPRDARAAARPEHVALPAPPAPAQPPSAAAWPRPAAVSLAELERRVAAAPAAQPRWQPYLAALREFGDADGRLPGRLEPLLEDVFGELAAPR